MADTGKDEAPKAKRGLLASLKLNFIPWVVFFIGLLVMQTGENMPNCRGSADYAAQDMSASQIYQAQKHGTVIEGTPLQRHESCRYLPAFDYKSFVLVLGLLLWGVAGLLAVRRDAAARGADGLKTQDIVLGGKRYRLKELVRIDKLPTRMGLLVFCTCLAVFGMFGLVYYLDQQEIGEEFRQQLLDGLNALDGGNSHDAVYGYAVIGVFFIIIGLIYAVLGRVFPRHNQDRQNQEDICFLHGKRVWGLSTAQKFIASAGVILLSVYVGTTVLEALHDLIGPVGDFADMAAYWTITLMICVSMVFGCVTIPLWLFAGKAVALIVTPEELDEAGIDINSLEYVRTGDGAAAGKTTTDDA